MSPPSDQLLKRPFRRLPGVGSSYPLTLLGRVGRGLENGTHLLLEVRLLLAGTSKRTHKYLGSPSLELEPSSVPSYATNQHVSSPNRRYKQETHSWGINQPKTSITKPIHSIIKTSNTLPFPPSPRQSNLRNLPFPPCITYIRRRGEFDKMMFLEPFCWPS